VDLLFHWPPTGGSWVDLREIAHRAQLAGHEVKLFVPHFDKYFPRGVIRQPLPFEVEIVEFDKDTLNAEILPKRFKKRVGEYKPDLIFVGDGAYLKPLLINELGKDFRTILRIYSHEILCFRKSMYLMPDFKRGIWNPFYVGPCNNHLLNDSARCYRCFFSGWKIPLIKALVGTGLSLSAFHYPHEYLAAKAYDRGYVDQVRNCFAHVSDIIVYNYFMADLIRPFHQNVHIIPSGIDADHFDIAASDNTGEIKHVLMSGRVTDPLKGFKVLLDGARLLRRQRQDFKILATFPFGKQSRTASYVENVGWWTQDTLPHLYEKSDIVVAPVLWQEPFGIIPLEAMSCRRPVIASDAGGHLVTIRDGETGLLFHTGDADDLAEKLSTLLDSHELRLQMGEKGRLRVLENYTWEIILERYYQNIF
jgi:glycosyltransferase involved in cell wall biosynthesis